MQDQRAYCWVRKKEKKREIETFCHLLQNVLVPSQMLLIQSSACRNHLRTWSRALQEPLLETSPPILLHISIQLLPVRGFIHPPPHIDPFTQFPVSSFFFLTQLCLLFHSNKTPHSPISHAFLIFFPHFPTYLTV